MLSAKEMFEATKGRNTKARDEKLEFVAKEIQAASDKEQFSTSFGFLQLKPFAGIVIEKLNELGYKVTQTGTKVSVSWDLTPKAEAKQALVKSEEDNIPPPSDDDYYDDDDENDDDDEEYDSGRW
jgi:hypothetical protein